MRKKITLDNRTEYRSDDLLRIVNAVMLEYHKSHAKPETLRLTCEYRRKRDGFCGGYAYYDNNLVILKLSKDVDKVYQARHKPGVGIFTNTDDQAMSIARTLTHELAHCRGLKHGDMEGDHKYNVEYVRGFPVRMKAERKPAPAPTVESKLERLEARRKKVEARIKRAQSALRKVLKSIQYYERKKAA